MITFVATALNGKLSFGSEYNEIRLRQFLLDNEGKQLWLTKPQTQRSKLQNNFYWAYLGIIEQETGNNSNDLHEFFKLKLLPPKEITIRGKEKNHILTTTRSTTELTKAEFTDYLDKICALTGVPIPDPTLLEGYISS